MYGFTASVLREDDSHHRLAGRVALALHPVDALSIGLSMNGRWDQHRGGSGADTSIVGDPRLSVLLRLVHAGAFRLGLGVRYWAHPHIGLSLASGLGGDAMSTVRQARKVLLLEFNEITWSVADRFMRRANRAFWRAQRLDSLACRVDGPDDAFTICDYRTAVDIGLPFTWRV